MEHRNRTAPGTRYAAWGRICLFVFPAIFVASLILLGVLLATCPPPAPTPPAPGVRLPNNAFFARGHAAADARTVLALFCYLVTPDGPLPAVAQLPATNQVPVNS
jgi:hypothetical protein